MATKPTIANAEWGTDATFTSGTEATKPVVVDPGAASRRQGFVPSLNFVGEWANWVIHQLYLWAVYLNDLHNSADFLNKTYVWIGTHTFNTNVVTLGEELQANAGIDTNGSTILTGAGNVLTGTGTIGSNTGGTIYTVGGAIRTEVAGTIEIDDATTGNFNFTGTKPSRTVTIPLNPNQDPSNGWVRPTGAASNAGVIYVTALNQEICLFTFQPPHGAVLTNVRVGMMQGTDATTNWMKMEVWHFEHNKVQNDGTGTATQLGSTHTMSTSYGTDSAGESATTGTISHTVDGQDTYYIAVTSSDTASTGIINDRVFYAQMTFEDPGPRNY